MMVANSFDLWQKDAFFTAAEEVQESADIMQSAYRMWIREKKEGSKLEDLDELSRELQTALGTAKWQLEEFERAVRLSHGHSCDDITASRHKQFIAAIESQISHVEAALREAFREEGQPLQWVNLNKEERDDLALFLSGTPQIPQIVKDDGCTLRPPMKSHFIENHHARKGADHSPNATFSGGSYNENDVNDVVTSEKNGEFIVDVDENEISRMRNDIICQADRTVGTRKTWSSPNFGTLKIVIADENEHRNGSMASIEATPKEKGSKRLFWKQRCAEYSQARGSSNLFNQLFGQVGGFQRQLQAPTHRQFSCSVQLTLALMLSIFLIVPFLIYSA